MLIKDELLALTAIRSRGCLREGAPKGATAFGLAEQTLRHTPKAPSKTCSKEVER